MRNGCLEEEKRCADVEMEDGVKVVSGDLGDGLHKFRGSVVDYDVNVTAECIYSSVDNGFAGGYIT